MNGSRIPDVMSIDRPVAIIYNFATKGFIGSLNFNFVIFLFLTINRFLYTS